MNESTMSTVKAKTEIFFSKQAMHCMRTVSQVKCSHAAFGDNERQFIKRHVNLDLAPESCIRILKLT